MKRYLNHIPIRTLMLLVWGALALSLTMLPKSVPLVGRLSRSLGSTPIGAALGHAGLFGGLLVMLYLALRLRLSHAFALLLALGVVLFISTGTELFQAPLADRDASLVDMLANWLGVFAAGFCVSYIGNWLEKPSQ